MAWDEHLAAFACAIGVMLTTVGLILASITITDPGSVHPVGAGLFLCAGSLFVTGGWGYLISALGG